MDDIHRDQETADSQNNAVESAIRNHSRSQQKRVIMTFPQPLRTRRSRNRDSSNYPTDSPLSVNDHIKELSTHRTMTLQELGFACAALDHHRTQTLLHEQGHCHEIGRHLWYPTGKTYLKAVRRICNECPVKRPCFLYALATKQTRGMWAGTTAHSRQQLSARINAVRATSKENLDGMSTKARCRATTSVPFPFSPTGGQADAMFAGATVPPDPGWGFPRDTARREEIPGPDESR